MNPDSPIKSDTLDELRAELASVDLAQTPVLSIPIWGWQGDGKTTSLLTVLHYAEPLANLLGFSPVREHDEISEVAQRDELRDTGILHLAKSSTVKIEELQGRFIDKCEWPDGTDTGSTYLVRVEDAATTRAFAVITDLPGGSYSENDAVAEMVIKDAHAIIVMVAPDRWLGQNLRARAYQNMVKYRIRRCTQLRIPVSVLVAQSDKDRTAANKVVEALRLSVEGFGASGACKIFAVSVITDEPFEQQQPEEGREPNPLPPAVDRSPSLLVAAWVWTLVKALLCEAESPSKRVPVIKLEQAARATDSQPTSLIELRAVGDFSSLPGTMICPIKSTGTECSFLVVREDGTLVEVTLNYDGSVPRLSNLGRLEAAEDLVHGGPVDTSETGESEVGKGNAVFVGLQGKVFNGELIVGPGASPANIWSGHLHDLVRPMPLPTSVVAWQALAADLVSGLDSEGRLHLFERDGNKWRQTTFIAEFLPSTEEGLFCLYIPNSRVVIAGDGSGTGAVRIDDRNFGDRVAPSLQPSYDADETDILSSTAGSVAHLDAEHGLWLLPLSQRHDMDLSIRKRRPSQPSARLRLGWLLGLVRIYACTLRTRRRKAFAQAKSICLLYFPSRR